MEDELLDIVNEADQVIGQAGRRKTYTGKLIYRAAWVVVEDEKGRILLQLRTKKKETFPDYWDISAAGHVDAGEDYLVAAKRELKEELGITANQLIEIGHDRFQANDGKNKLDRFCKIYKIMVTSDTSFHLQDSEVAKVQWLAPVDVLSLPDVHPDLIAVVNRYYLK